MMTTRPRNAGQTRAAILAAARTLFASQGFDRTTMRAVAKEAGCDPVMAYRYFGSKQALFVEAVSLDLQLPDLAQVPRGQVVERMLGHFFKVWEDDPIFIGLLRASASSEEAAEAMRSFFVESVLPRLREVVKEGSPQQAALAGSVIIGLAWSRYILRNPLLAGLSREDFVRLAGPALEAALSGAAPHDPQDQPR